MPQLSCEQCRTRKTKCDKQSPCSACKSAGITCHAVQRARLPRGKSSKTHGQKIALESRVARLEALLHQAQTCKVDVKTLDDGLAKAKVQTNGRNTRLDGFVASTFWSALASEVAGIRDTLEVSDEEDESPPIKSSSSSSPPEIKTSTTSPSDTNSLIFPSLRMKGSKVTRLSLDESLRTRLLDAYAVRIDSVFKPVHWPTVRSAIEQRGRSSHIQDSLDALSSAVEFMAVCSLSEAECRDTLYISKLEALANFRTSVEIAITSARVLTEPDISGLQAFVIYLQALRTCRGHALNWTLLAVAVRLATALGLGRRDSHNKSSRDVEIRRRVWYSICLMDTQATLDRGSVPLIHADELGPAPTDCNDADLLDSVNVSLKANRGFTDMSFSIMTFKAMTCFKRISAIGSDNDGTWANWEKKVVLLQTLKDDFEKSYFQIDLASATPIQHLTRAGAHTILADMHLLLRRPAYRQGTNNIPPWDEFDPLLAATAALEGHINMDVSRLAIWAWKEWTPWYALAVALAELCRTPTGPVSDRAYTAATTMYQRYSAPASDRDQGMLWKPITRLLRRVTLLRKQSGPAVTHGRQSMAFASVPFEAAVPFLSQDVSPADQSCHLSDDVDASQVWQMPLDFDMTDTFNFDLNLTENALDSLETLDLHPENGVSWLDWDLLLHDYEATNTLAG